MEQLYTNNPKPIISVYNGPIASGKSTICKNIVSRIDKHVHISVSSIVKSLQEHAVTREELQNTKTLFNEIGDLLIERVSQQIDEGNSVMVDGFRQVQPLQKLTEWAMVNDIEIALYWVDVPKHERARRYLDRHKDELGDVMSYNQAHQRDVDLGLNQVECYTKQYDDGEGYDIDSLWPGHQLEL